MVRLFLVVALLFSFLWEASPISGPLPFQFLAMLAFLMARHPDGAYWATLAGFLADLASGTPLGVFAFSFTLSALFLHWITGKILPTPRTMIFLLLVFLLIKDLVAMGLLSLFSTGYSLSIKSYVLTLLAYYPIYIRNARKFRET